MVRVLIGKSDDFPLGETKTVKADNKMLVVARTASGLCAVVNRCSHLSLPLAGGKIEGDSIICPWHNSKFNLCTGENEDWVPDEPDAKMPDWTRKLKEEGKNPTSLTTFPVIEEDGEVFVEV